MAHLSSGFEVIDGIKAAIKKECPHTVSCADILALAARDSIVLTGGPYWDLPLGRRDSKGASLSGSNNNIPGPNSKFQTILTKCKLKGLDIVDLVTLFGKLPRSEATTIINAQCTNYFLDCVPVVRHQTVTEPVFLRFCKSSAVR
ncbi:hypothetical protein V6N12_023731 [Hibiscus sabdariffa]|uniref:peroxidase n=1 Tax=Hibiscus sabdariffa TaxID=183260 RepID=A0ABR2FYH9_9ROSI